MWKWLKSRVVSCLDGDVAQTRVFPRRFCGRSIAPGLVFAQESRCDVTFDFLCSLPFPRPVLSCVCFVFFRSFLLFCYFIENSSKKRKQISLIKSKLCRVVRGFFLSVRCWKTESIDSF